MAGKVQGKVAIVTGAAHGMGRSHCLVLAREEADIAAVDICRDVPLNRYALGTEDELGSLIKEIRATGRRAIGAKCDVSKGAEVERMVQKVVKEFGKIDILVNNVGMVGAGGPVTEMTEEQWDLMLAVNLKSQFLCCKYVLPHMMKQKSGKIINFGSVSGREGSAGGTAYAAAKAGVHNFTLALAKEVTPYNINVNCIAPGAVNTPMLQGAAAAGAEAFGVKPEEYYDSLCKYMHILGREITVEDISNTVLFLASEDSRNIDGSVIFVDGGHIRVP
jgi:NAD(P)-dependent dehydrogenase (short-subunit alcohol dehydrogenase family)